VWLATARSPSRVDLLVRFKDTTKHDQTVAVHSCHSAQRLAHIISVDAQRSLWLEEDFSFVTGFDVRRVFNFGVAGGILASTRFSTIGMELWQFGRGWKE